MTAEDHKSIANEVYLVDPLALDPPRNAGDTFYTAGDKAKQQFEVYDTATDSVTGFQAMAVVPLVDGAADYSKVFVAYAGTNPGDRADVVADAQSVVGGQSVAGTQVFEALEFAGRVQERLQIDGHSDATITTIGHSLGGYLALFVAAENHWSATSFNGPDPWEGLTPQAKKWLEDARARGRSPLTNYVNEYDVIGNLLGNGTGAALYVKDTAGKDLLDYHNLSAFEMNPDGSIAGVGALRRAME